MYLTLCRNETARCEYALAGREVGWVQGFRVLGFKPLSLKDVVALDFSCNSLACRFWKPHPNFFERALGLVTPEHAPYGGLSKLWSLFGSLL